MAHQSSARAAGRTGGRLRPPPRAPRQHGSLLPLFSGSYRLHGDSYADCAGAHQSVPGPQLFRGGAERFADALLFLSVLLMHYYFDHFLFSHPQMIE
ncbi:hypothetical protein SBA3_1500002 [Candidatus Sulfopaludibacter sp. SbA3]|nr:hypothetical protein SBA3_1500002 [Candidatus Sulfopaludibacter sp. SbA3]